MVRILRMDQELSGDPKPQYFLKRIAVQMVLQYRWEVYCWVSLSSRLRSQEGKAIQTGPVLPYKGRVPMTSGVAPAKPNPRKADSQAGSRIWGVSVNSERFFPGKTRRIHKTPQIRELHRCLCILLVSPGKNTPNSQKHPKFANRLANRSFFGLVLPGRPLMIWTNDVLDIWASLNQAL